MRRSLFLFHVLPFVVVMAIPKLFEPSCSYILQWLVFGLMVVCGPAVEHCSTLRILQAPISLGFRSLFSFLSSIFVLGMATLTLFKPSCSSISLFLERLDIKIVP